MAKCLGMHTIMFVIVLEMCPGWGPKMESVCRRRVEGGTLKRVSLSSRRDHIGRQNWRQCESELSRLEPINVRQCASRIAQVGSQKMAPLCIRNIKVGTQMSGPLSWRSVKGSSQKLFHFAGEVRWWQPKNGVSVLEKSPGLQ